MWSWIVVLALYLLGMGCFHVLGGLRAAGEALERWGRASAVTRLRRASASRN
jgi:hypothetical protein